MVDTSKQMGTDAERKFVDIMRSNGHKVTSSNRYQDMHEHWDFMIDGVDTVEVKSRKKTNRHNQEVDDEVIFIEFKNVRGDDGWVYGKAKYMAFETVEGFILVPRSLLATLAEERIKATFMSRPTLYKSYRRRDRPDEHVGLIKFSDLLTLPHKVFVKNA